MSSLIWKGDQFIFVGSYEERLIPKQAGFRWFPDVKQWATSDPEVARHLARYADGEAKRKLAEAEQRRRETLAASSATDAEVEVPCPPGLVYLPFQRAGIAFVLNVLKGGEASPSCRRGVLLADEMG